MVFDVKAYQKSYRDKNKAKTKAYNADYRKTNEEHIHKQQREYYQQNKEKIIQYIKQYKQKNRDKVNETHRTWRRNNKKTINRKQREYRKLRREKCNEYNARYRKNNEEKVKECNKKYYESNYDKIYQKHKEYLKTPSGKSLIRRHWNKRHRNYGFNPLNEYFVSSEGHHINYVDVVYIPSEVHRDFYGKHTPQIPVSMIAINYIAFFFLMQQNIEELSTMFSQIRKKYYEDAI